MTRISSEQILKPADIPLPEAIGRLESLASSGEKLLATKPVSEIDYSAWVHSAGHTLGQIYGLHARLPIGTVGQIEPSLQRQVRYIRGLIAALPKAPEVEGVEQAVSEAPIKPAPTSDLLDVFISHSSKDKPLAQALLDLVRHALQFKMPEFGARVSWVQTRSGG